MAKKIKLSAFFAPIVFIFALFFIFLFAKGLLKISSEGQAKSHIILCMGYDAQSINNFAGKTASSDYGEISVSSVTAAKDSPPDSWYLTVNTVKRSPQNRKFHFGNYIVLNFEKNTELKGVITNE